MGRLSAKLRSVSDGIVYWCPGCQSAHAITRSIWQWDGNVDAPTISPSVLISSGHYISTHKPDDACWCSFNAKQAAEGKRQASFKCQRCHSFVRAGRIEFLTDSSHQLAGQTVDLPDWPHAEGEYGGV